MYPCNYLAVPNSFISIFYRINMLLVCMVLALRIIPLTCLADGAALFYTSVKEDKNCDLLHRYILHRIYDFPFNTPAFVVERDSVFV